MTRQTVKGRQLHASGAYLGGSDDSELRWMGETCTLFLATGATTDGKFCLIDEIAKRGEAVPLHRHSEDVESFYVLAGQVTFYIEQEPGLTVGAGAFLHVPAGTIHGFRIASDSARYLILTTPRHGDFYRAISIPAGIDGQPATFEVDWDNILAISEQFGIELIGDLPEA
jgi:quercetin dioxygenase-like cupin family protein